MKSKLIKITVTFLVMIVIVSAAFFYSQGVEEQSDIQTEYVVALNEIEQLTKEAVISNSVKELENIQAKIFDLQTRLQNQIKPKFASRNYQVLAISGIGILFVVLVFGYIYIAVLGPFDKMRNYAEKIAAGDLDVTLDYERSNYFGKFTWAFDQMRREIKKSRACEKEAIENNKTVIATLSHDIKTPIASIRAYAEGLEANLDGNIEKRAKYLAVIMKKCDEVAGYTNDLFLHSLSDLDKLKIETRKTEIIKLLSETIAEMQGESDDISFTCLSVEAYAAIDHSRFVQVIENLINNARKYARTMIDVTTVVADDQLQITFQDYGSGIPDEDMPFIYDKFYRGRNSGDEQGSGLGLYIVKYIMEQIKGEIQLHNREKGLEVNLILQLAGRTN